MASTNYQDQPAEAGTLIPAGLPFAYVSTWATAGIASLAYLSFAVTYPGSEPQKIDATSTMAQAQKDALPELPTVLEKPRVKTVRVRPATADEEEENRFDTPEEANARIADVQDAPAVLKNGNSPFGTNYVTTSQILANSPEKESDREEIRAAAATPPEDQTSSIVTGSIVVPPPPDRSPPKPAVLRSTINSASKRAGLVKKKTVARLPKAPAAPPNISFGPAVVKPAAVEPAKPSGLAVMLATGSSVDSLRSTWDLLQERHSAALSNLTPRYVVEANPSVPGRKYVLLAGPVLSANDVARVCSVLVSEGLSCRTRAFGGNAM